MSEPITIDFDHLAPAFGADPAAAFAQLRAECPVAKSPHHGGFWLFTRYKDVVQIASQDETFSNARYPADAPTASFMIPAIELTRACPAEYDRPEALTYRRMLNPLLTPEVSARRLRPVSDRLATYFVDQFIESGTCDLIGDLASPLPALLTLDWLGVPRGEWRRFADMVHNFTAEFPGSDLHNAAVADHEWANDLYLETVAARRKDPQDDAISYLVQQKVDGSPLSDELMMEFISVLIAGGINTSTSLAGQTLKFLHEHHEHRRQLQLDPSLMPAATEEFLRFFSPVTTLARTVTEDVEIDGQQLRSGDHVMLPWAAANRDPNAFDRPDEVDFNRGSNRHVAFGFGLHKCVGAHMARQDFQSLLTAVLGRLPDYEIDVSSARPYPSQGIVSGWASLPATFTPGPRSGLPSPFPELV